MIEKQLLLVSERSPEAVWVPLKLPYWDRDPNTNSIRFLTGNPGTPFMEVVSVLSPQLPNAAYNGVPYTAGYPSYYISPLITAPPHPKK